MMRKLIDIITEASRDIALKGSNEGQQRIADALKSLGYAAACKDTKLITNSHPDPVLSKMVEASCCTFDVQFSKTKTRARDVLTEVAREAGLDMQVAMSTQAKDGSTWLHTYLHDDGELVAAASARDAARHRDHPDFGSYLFIEVKACDEAPVETKYTKTAYTDTEQRECVKVTNPAGEVIFDGPKKLFPGLPVEEGRSLPDRDSGAAFDGKWENKGRTARYNDEPRRCPTRRKPERKAWLRGWDLADEERTVKEELRYEQKGHGYPEPVGSLPDTSFDDIKKSRAEAAKRVAAKRAERAARASQK
jgi:hypothetical protein